MPVQTNGWTEFLSCPVCCHEFDGAERKPISLGCGHTLCLGCLASLGRKTCPFDQAVISVAVPELPINAAILRLLGLEHSVDVSSVPGLTDEEKQVLTFCLSSVACLSVSLLLSLSRPLQRKLVMLINCQFVESEGRARAVRACRSLGERAVNELVLLHQNPLSLSTNLWAAVRSRGCQFLGPAMQEEVLRLVLLALEDGSALSRKVLVMFIVQRLEPHFPQASKTSIGHVVQLLYRASCFKVTKREGESSLMQLKEEFRVYDVLRREHDAQIVSIATEAGLRIAPDQWSALLYGDSQHKSHMQSILDKLQTPEAFKQSVNELLVALQKTGDPGKLLLLRGHYDMLAGIDATVSDTDLATVKEALVSVDAVLKGLKAFTEIHGKQAPHHVANSLNNNNSCKFKWNKAQQGLSVSSGFSKAALAGKSLVALEKRRTEILDKLGVRPGAGVAGIAAAPVAIYSTPRVSSAVASSMKPMVSPTPTYSPPRALAASSSNSSSSSSLGRSVASYDRIDSDDEFIPFTPGPTVCKFGPISRIARAMARSSAAVQVSSIIGGSGMLATSSVDTAPTASVAVNGWRSTEQVPFTFECGNSQMARFGDLKAEKTVFLACDFQEKLLNVVKHGDVVRATGERMVEAAGLFGIEVVATAQYPEKLGPSILPTAVPASPKSGFSMLASPVVSCLLDELIQIKGVESVVLFGVEAHICIEATVIALKEKFGDSIAIQIVADGCSSRRQEDRILGFRRMEKLGCFITTAETVLFRLLGGKEHAKFREVSKLAYELLPETGLLGSL